MSLPEPIQFNNIAEEDLTSLLFECDYDYVKQRFESYDVFLRTWHKFHPKQSPFNPFYMNYLNTIHFITKNAVVATVIMILALTTVSASAAELFAPIEYKPSKLLGITKQEVNNPIPLAEEDVLKSETLESSSSSSSYVSSNANSSTSKVNSSSSVSSKSGANNSTSIYTNSDIPGFNLNYKGWSIDVKKEDAKPLGVEAGDPRLKSEIVYLTLSKETAQVKFEIQTYSTGGIPAPGGKIQQEVEISSGGVKTSRVKIENSTWLYGQRATGTFPFLEYSGNDSVAAFFWKIQYTGSESLLPEVDKMILNSGIKF